MIVLPQNIFLPRKKIDAHDAQNMKSTMQNNKPQRYLIIQPHEIVNLACIMEQSQYKFFFVQHDIAYRVVSIWNIYIT